MSSSANAASEPAVVKAEVQRAASECRSKGGKPNTDAMLTARDLTRRGGPDWIVDFAKLRCGGAPNPFCGSGGCALQIFVWTDKDGWTSAFSELVTKYRVRKTGRGQTIDVWMAGAACDKRGVRSCRRSLRFNKDGSVSGPPHSGNFTR